MAPLKTLLKSIHGRSTRHNPNNEYAYYFVSFIICQCFCTPSTSEPQLDIISKDALHWKLINFECASRRELERVIWLESAERRLKNVICARAVGCARARHCFSTRTVRARHLLRAYQRRRDEWMRKCVLYAVTWQKVGGWRASRGDICRVNDLRLLPPIFMHINEAAAAAPLIAFICSDFCFRAAPVRWRGKEGTGSAPRPPTRHRPRGLSVCATNIIHCSGGALIRVKSCLRFPPLRRKLFRPTPIPADYTCWMLTFHQTACLRDLICMHLSSIQNSYAFIALSILDVQR